MKPALAELLHNPLVWRGDQLARVEETVPSGFAALDGELPGGGWPQGVLTELLLDAEGIGELRLLLPALRRLTRASGWIAFVAPPHLLHAPAFAVSGVDPAKLIVIDANDEKNRWWAAEQVLRANSAGALLFWPEAVSDQRLRRLQLAAQDGKSPAFVFAGAARAAQSSPAPLRLRLARAGTMLRIDVFKRRGGVVTRPLLLDVATTAPLHMKDERPGMSPIRVAATPGRASAVHSARFNRRYPIDTPQAPVWNRALARADEVRRSPNPDPRG